MPLRNDPGCNEGRPRLKRITPAKHHWWPESLSGYWSDEEGKVNWLLPTGEVRRQPPRKFGAIRDGHTIRMSDEPGAVTPWDESFESTFDDADSSFHHILAQLNELDRCGPPFEVPITERFVSTPVPQPNFGAILRCALSLIVRSPQFRRIAGAYSVHYGVAGYEKSVKRVMLGNMRHSLDHLTKAFRGTGKAVAIFSPERELVFGDGFFTNITPPAQHNLRPRAIVPLTPSLALLIQKPGAYRLEPNLCTLVVNREEAAELNKIVQIYAREMIFYRSERPKIVTEFKKGEHFRFADDRNFADQLCFQVPGVRDQPTPDWFYNLEERR